MINFYKKSLIIVFTLIIAISGLYFFYYKTAKPDLYNLLAQETGISVDTAKGFVISKKVTDEESSELFIEAEKKINNTDNFIRVKLMYNIDRSEYLSYTNHQKLILASLYEPVPPPYPEFLGKKVSCDEKYRPITKNNKWGDFYLLYANDRFGYGLCQDDTIKYKATLGYFYNEDKKVLLKFEHFAPFDKIFYKEEVSKVSKNNKDKNKVEIFTVSACPFTRDLIRTLVLFLDDIDPNLRKEIEVDTFFYGREEDEGKFISFHGKEESNLNILELCIIDKYVEDFEGIRILDCLNQRVDLQDADKSIIDLMKNWEECTGNVKVNKNQQVINCAGSQEGIDLYRESIKKILTDREAKFPPTLKFNGKNFLPTNSDAFKLELCKNINSPSCDNLPECINDTNCLEKDGYTVFCTNNKCEYKENIKAIVLKDNFINDVNYFSDYAIDWYELLLGELNVEYLDINTDKGVNLSQELGLSEFPVILISDDIEKTSVFKEAFGPIKYVFSKKLKDWYMVDHERFFLSGLFVKESEDDSMGTHFINSDLSISEEMKEIFNDIKMLKYRN